MEIISETDMFVIIHNYREEPHSITARRKTTEQLNINICLSNEMNRFIVMVLSYLHTNEYHQMKAEVFIQYLIGMQNLDDIHNLKVLVHFCFKYEKIQALSNISFPRCYNNMWRLINHNDWSNQLE